MSSMPPNPSFNCRGTGGSFNAEVLFSTWVDRVKIMGLPVSDYLSGDRTQIAENFLAESFSQTPDSAIPGIGDPHPIYQRTFCQSVRIVPMPTDADKAPDGVYADVTWIQGNTNDSGKPVRAVYTSPYQIQEIRNFDNMGKRTKVFYQITNPDPRFPPYRIADVRVPRTMYGIKIVQYEEVTDGSIGSFCGFNDDISSTLGASFLDKLPIYNTVLWNGFPANVLAHTGGILHYEGIPLARREYDFLTNDRGWNKYIGVYTQQNGYVPKDLDDLNAMTLDPAHGASDIPAQNGIGVFDMLSSQDFNQLLPLIASERF